MEEVVGEPERLRSISGKYVNLLDLLDHSALTLPTGMYDGSPPWGLTMFADAGMDRALMEYGYRYEETIGRQKSAVFHSGFEAV